MNWSESKATSTRGPAGKKRDSYMPTYVATARKKAREPKHSKRRTSDRRKKQNKGKEKKTWFSLEGNNRGSSSLTDSAESRTTLPSLLCKTYLETRLKRRTSSSP